MGFGTFDRLHPGHLSYLKQLRLLGDTVVVVVARDLNVKKLKGKAPLEPQHRRVEAVKGTGLADAVVLGRKNDFFACLREFEPDVIGLGYDQKADVETIRHTFPTIKIRRMRPYKPERYKSSLERGGVKKRPNLL